jgi:hypothetical protein
MDVGRNYGLITLVHGKNNPLCFYGIIKKGVQSRFRFLAVWKITNAEEYYLLGYDITYSGRIAPTFRRYVLLLTTESKSKKRKHQTTRVLTLPLVFLTFRPWRLRQYVSSKPLCTLTVLHVVTSQNSVCFTVTAVRTANPTFHRHMNLEVRSIWRLPLPLPRSSSL